MMLNNFNFLYPKSRYYGEVKPENLVFDANLQEFAQRVNYISALAGNGKIPLDVAMSEIELLWENLENSKKELGVGEHPFAA
jgi:sigma54-dependent transcription regulator